MRLAAASRLRSGEIDSILWKRQDGGALRDNCNFWAFEFTEASPLGYVLNMNRGREPQSKEEEKSALVVVDARQELVKESVDGSAKSNASADIPLKTIIAERYEVLEQLGSGGMATVFKVRHIHLNRIYALKVLKGLNKAESVRRFQQEAKALSVLEHPHIVAVRDFGVTSDQQPFMLMDYLEGQSLAQKIKTEGPIPPDKAIHLFGQLAGALAHAHAEGIVHRDIKPSNIMIRIREDGTEQAVLVDFGIAKLQAAEELNQAKNDKLTQTGDIFGTPQYMSCEQCLGLPVDERSDIYSFGCVMFESLTGKAPFFGDSVYEIIHKQINEAPPPFPKELRKTLAGGRLEVLILRAMAKSPKNRQEYMLELASELQYCAGSAGAMGKVKTILGRLSGRRRAAEGKAALTKSLLRGLSFLCILTLLVLLISPVVINGIERGKARHQQIFDAVADFNTRFSSETNRRLEQRRAFLPSLENVGKGCAGDPLYEKKYDLVLKRFSTFKAALNDLFAEASKYDEEPSIPKLALPGLIAKGGKLSDKGRAFHDALDRLNDIARDKIYDANHLLQLISFIDKMALFVLIPIVLGIAVLLVNLRNEQAKANEAVK